MKKCRKCGEEKPNTNEFFPWKRKERLQLDGRCRKCKNADDLRRYFKMNDTKKEKKRQSDRLRAAKKRAENPEYFKALQQKRRSSANYKAWYEKQKEANREKVFLRNIGSFCSVSPIKCRVCDSCEVKRGDNNANICRSCVDKGLHVKGLVFNQKEVVCKSCGNIHFSKRKGSKCKACIVDAKKAYNHASKSGKRFTQRCAKYGGLYTQINRSDVYNRDNWTCVYCGVKVVKSRLYTPNQATIDHVIPLSKGGTHTMDNVVTACHCCNSKKSNRTVLMANKTKQLVMWMR